MPHRTSRSATCERSIEDCKRHFLAPTSETSPDLIEADRAAPAVAGDEVVGLVGRLLLGVGDRAQRQRQAVGHLLGDGDDLGLLRRQLQRRGLADLDLLAFLVLLDGLVDGQHADVLEDGLGDEAVAAAAPPCAARRVMITST